MMLGSPACAPSGQTRNAPAIAKRQNADWQLRISQPPALAFRLGVTAPRRAPPHHHAPYDGADDRQGGDDVKHLQCAVAAVGGDAKDLFDEIHAAFSFLPSDHVTDTRSGRALGIAQAR